MRDLKGIYPAIVTPFDDSGSFDSDSMKRIVQYQLNAGADGFYVCGGTGEGLLLTLEERLAAIDCVLKEVDGRAGVIAHIGAFHTVETVIGARQASDAGVDAISALPPAYFYRPDDRGLVQYYTQIVEASDVPLLIYNIPQRTGITMTPGLFDSLIKLPNVIGMKDSSGDIDSLQGFLSQGSDLVIFEGEDSVVLPAIQAGASGGIGATYNVMPQLFVKVWRAFQKQDIDTAVSAQLRIKDIIDALTVVDLFGGLKQTLAWMGLECGVPRTPNRSLTSEETTRLRDSLNAEGFFDEER